MKGRFNPRRARVTLAEARVTLRDAGVALSKRDGEYRVNFLGGREASAYYTNDLVDAIRTGLDMARRLAAREWN